MNKHTAEKQKLYRAAIIPLAFTLLLWMIKGVEIVTESNFARFGLYPLDVKGLRGIILMPLIHGSWEHLINNSIPILVLATALFYFYREVSYKVFFLIYLIHAFWLWFFARGSYHIGASGIIYGLGAFIFISGIIRKNTNLLAISLIVAFQYGSMVWGIFPLEESISWEGHLTGMTAGIILAFYFKNYGPPSNIKRWKVEMHDDDESDEEDSEDESNAYWKLPDDLNDEDRKLLE